MTVLDDQVNTLQKAMKSLADRFSDNSLNAQKQNLECALRCFPSADAVEGKSDIVQNCMQRCARPFGELQQVAQKEFGGVQNSLGNCQRACQAEIAPQIDAIQKGLQAVPSDADQATMKMQMEQCASQCVQKAQTQLPDLEKRLDGYLQKTIEATGAPQAGA